jgi:soluble lytic murein transglycosylase-like protein
MPGPWTNPCGGKRWRLLPSGLIEVEGEGTPVYEPGRAQYGYLERTWGNWGPLFEAAAAAHGVPASWPLAFATIETGLWSSDPARQASIVSPAGAQGVMQLMPATARIYGIDPSERADPALNIDAGTALIADLVAKYGDPVAATAPYNSGGLCTSRGYPNGCVGRNEWNLCADHNYPRAVIQWNNAAIEYLGVGKTSALRSIGWAMALGGAALLGLAYYRAA